MRGEMRVERLIAMFVLVLGMLGCQHPEKGRARVCFEKTGEGDVFFQLAESKNYEKLEFDEAGKLEWIVSLEKPTYYAYMDARQKIHQVLLTPGCVSEIREDAEGVHFAGDNAAENQFLSDNVFTGFVSKDIRPYSREWQDAVKQQVDDLKERLRKGGFSADFVRLQSLNYDVQYYYLLLSSPGMASTFRGEKVNLCDGYYDFLREIHFDDPWILNVPNWFAVMETMLDCMEKEGMIEVDADRFPEIYAKRIGNREIAACFLEKELEMTLKKGYMEDFLAIELVAKSWCQDTAMQGRIERLHECYVEERGRRQNIARGMEAPFFEAVDVNGKKYSLEDFRGKVLVLDFWFTGCLPCLAEMPYMERIAEEMQGLPIRFVAMSVDTGKELLTLWRNMVMKKEGNVLQLNVPGGFKSELVKQYHVQGVPRIVIIDQNGKIVDAFARRPSDPKFKQRLEKTLL